MEAQSVGAIVTALNTANVRYLVVGGLAVVAHGYVRFTADVDLIVDLEPANTTPAVTMSSDEVRTIWERGWEGHETHQRERLSGLSLAEKLRWLEEAHYLVLLLSRVTPKPTEQVDDASKPRP